MKRTIGLTVALAYSALTTFLFVSTANSLRKQLAATEAYRHALSIVSTQSREMTAKAAVEAVMNAPISPIEWPARPKGGD